MNQVDFFGCASASMIEIGLFLYGEEMSKADIQDFFDTEIVPTNMVRGCFNGAVTPEETVNGIFFCFSLWMNRRYNCGFPSHEKVEQLNVSAAALVIKNCLISNVAGN